MLDELIAFFFGAKLQEGAASGISDDVGDLVQEPVGALATQFFHQLLVALFDLLGTLRFRGVVLRRRLVLGKGKHWPEQAGGEEKREQAANPTIHEDTSLANRVGGKA